ncbi:MAG: class I SAM-dependent methyltransferase [Rhizomicrobium sp.]
MNAHVPPPCTDGLSGVSETLLITLAARAIGTARLPRSQGRDVTAERLCRELGVDLTRYGASKGTIKGVIARGTWFDSRCLWALDRHDNPLFVSLGSGLNTMYERIASRAGTRRFTWIDSDVADVVTLRRRCLADDERRRTIVLDISTPDWLGAIGWTAARPVVFIAEGVLMYLEEQTAGALFRTLAQAFATRAPAQIVFDWASPTMVARSRQHPAVGRIKDRSVAFRWSLRRASDVARFDPRWRIAAQHDVMRESGTAPALFGLFYRLTTGRRFYGCAHATLG